MGSGCSKAPPPPPLPKQPHAVAEAPAAATAPPCVSDIEAEALAARRHTRRHSAFGEDDSVAALVDLVATSPAAAAASDVGAATAAAAALALATHASDAQRCAVGVPTTLRRLAAVLAAPPPASRVTALVVAEVLQNVAVSRHTHLYGAAT